MGSRLRARPKQKPVTINNWDMKNFGRFLAITAIAGLTAIGTNNGLAQDNAGRQGGRGNFDPAQMRQRMMERYKEMLEVTNDDEWKALEPLVTKVMEARMQSMSGMGRGFMGRPRGGDNAQGGDRQGADRQRPGGRQADPAAEALEKAVDAKAGKAELKAALTKYVEARKAKQAALETAQEELRKVLTARQEAIATLNGLL